VRDELLAPNALEPTANGECRLSAVTVDILRALTISLPNDLAHLIFLATLRDNNSGHHYHPEVAQRFSAEIFFMKVGVAVAILEARLPGRVQ
jgi:hypothetical protein